MSLLWVLVCDKQKNVEYFIAEEKWQNSQRRVLNKAILFDLEIVECLLVMNGWS